MLNAIQQWYQSATGVGLLRFEKEQANKWLPLVHGANILQIGGFSDMFGITAQQHRACYFVAFQEGDAQAAMVAVPEYLPLQRDCINFAMLVHVLEYCENPQQLLAELFRVLTPNGKLLLFTFNPWSTWGLKKMVASTQEFPWCGRFISPIRLQQWLRYAGYSHLKDKTLYFNTPWMRRPSRRTTLFLETLGQIVIPMLGAVNVFLVEKRVYGTISDNVYLRQPRTAIDTSGMVRPSTRITSR